MNNKIKVAVTKFAALCTGGTEKYLQTVAANLDKDKFDVDFFYCDAAPYIGGDFKHPNTDLHRKKYMQNHKINLIKFDVAYKDIRTPLHTWIDTNFWEVFDEKKYDVLITAKAGHNEYPYCNLKEIPIVEIVTLPNHFDPNPLIKATVHLSIYQAETWYQAAQGNVKSAVYVLPIFEELPHDVDSFKDKRRSLKLKKDTFVYGFHQRPDPGIFSPIPLMAYKEVEKNHENVAFVLLGGAEEYTVQARQLELKNFTQLPATGDDKEIHSFLKTLDVYSHGRKDGETGGLAISEAMFHRKPIISHVAPAMGHVETIGPAGIVAQTLEEYVKEMVKLLNDKEYYQDKSMKSIERFETKLSLHTNMHRFNKLIERVHKNNQKNKLSGDDFWNSVW